MSRRACASSSISAKAPPIWNAPRTEPASGTARYRPATAMWRVFSCLQGNQRPEEAGDALQPAALAQQAEIGALAHHAAIGGIADEAEAQQAVMAVAHAAAADRAAGKLLQQ